MAWWWRPDEGMDDLVDVQKRSAGDNDGATYLFSPRRLGGLALGVPGLRLIGILGFGPTTIWWRNRTDILLQRFGRIGSMSDLFVHPLSVGSGGCRLARHGMLIVDKTTKAIERNLNRSFWGVRAKVLAWRL